MQTYVSSFLLTLDSAVYGWRNVKVKDAVSECHTLVTIESCCMSEAKRRLLSDEPPDFEHFQLRWRYEEQSWQWVHLEHHQGSSLMELNLISHGTNFIILCMRLRMALHI